MKIEDILKEIMICIEQHDEIGYYLDNEDLQTLLNYITTLQRKEYNNSKAIELIHKLLNEEVVIEDAESMYYGEKCQRSYFSDSELGQVLNILEKGE